MASFNQNMAFSGLGTFALIPAPAAGVYFVEGHMSLPTIVNGGGASSALVVVNVNGSPMYTGVAGAEGFKADLVLAASDAVTVVVSSAAAADAPLNVIKGNISFGQGV